MTLLGLGNGYVIDDLTDKPYRGFYNVAANILAFFAALFYLASPKIVYKSFTYILFFFVSTQQSFFQPHGVGLLVLVLYCYSIFYLFKN